MIEIFISIITYFLISIVFDLAKILLFFILLVLFFDFTSIIDTSSKNFAIFSTKTRALTVIFIFFLIFVKELIIKYKYIRLSIN